ncbi:MAG: response regulator [bacterium]|nr:response regulator [bacterium]
MNETENLKILIVDDLPSNLMVLEKFLHQPGVDIIKAGSGNEALGLTLEHDFALVLLDVQMPDMDGFETAELMRGNPETANIPIIFVTAISKEKRHIFDGYEAGAVDYIFKPVDPHSLQSKVNVFLELHKNKLALKSANKKLEKALKRANKLAIEADRANRAKSDFLATMSHELRTPMNGVIGMTGLLLDTNLTTEQREFVETVRKSADTLLLIMNDIMDFSKIEAGKLGLELLDFNLRTTMEDTADILALRADKKGLAFVFLIEPEVPSLLHGDPGRLRQVIVNLVENAVKFTHQGEVLVKITLVKEDYHQLTLKVSVVDTGIGIPKDRLHVLFDPFIQVETSTTRKYGGTGLGLTISKQLVEMMQGEIGVASEEGKGTTFSFTAVFEKQPAVAEPTVEALKGISGERILVVDDSAANRRLLSLLLDSWDCRYTVVPNANAAISELKIAAEKSDPFRIAILDMQMPGMDGESLGRKIKTDTQINKTLLMMITSLGRRGDVSRLEEIGFSAYLTKPIKQSLLYECLVTVHSDRIPIPAKAGPRIVTRHSIAEAKWRKFRVLVAGDNDDNLQNILSILEKLGCRGDAAANQQQIFRAIETIRYDLILINCTPSLLESCKIAVKIRENETQDAAAPRVKTQTNHIPIIAITGDPNVKKNHTCLEAEIDDTIAKPVDPKTLIEKIEKWLAKPGKVIAEAPIAFDRAGLLERLMDDEELVMEIVSEFIKEFNERFAEMEKALENQDNTVLRNQGHTIKGTAGNIGAASLQKVAARIEAVSGAGDIVSATALLGQLKEQFELFKKETEV